MTAAPSSSGSRDPLERLAEEFLARVRRGENPTVEEYALRHPDLAAEIRDLLPTMLAVDGLAGEDRAGRARLPEMSSLGHYRIERELGRGGMGIVYRARDLRRGQVVALKTVLWAEPTALLRFKGEFRALADVTHRNLATLYELFSEEGRWFFTMELVEGVDFLSWVRGDPARLRPAFLQLAEGVTALHAAGLLHRDLKPSNVMVTREGRVVILDFGLAAEVLPGKAHQSTQHHAVGTPAYMSPEQANGAPVTPASDWYAFGTILYEALTGRQPFEGSAVEILLAKQGADPEPPSRLAPGADPDLDQICAGLLRRGQEDRPGGAEILAVLGSGGAEGSRRPTGDRPATVGPGLVGREPHLRALRDAYAALRERRPVVALVHGNSGMGKSSLVQEFLDELAKQGEAVILAGRCYERESVPYKALDGPIDVLTRHLGRMPRAEAAALLPRDVSSLARVFPILGRVEAVSRAPPPAVEIPDPQEVRRRGFAGLREVFGRIADHRPLVVFVDDLQWGDADSAGLLSTLLRSPDAPAILFLGCYRREDEAASSFLQAFRRAGEGVPVAREIRVDPLSGEEARSLAATLLRGRGGSAAKAEALAREAGGSPLFLHELTVHGEGAGEGATLEDVIRERVKALPPEARRLVEVVAVSGGPVSQAPAAFAAGLESGAQAALASLRGSRLLRTKGVGDRDELDTYHDRVREAVLADLEPEELQEFHRRLGLALEMEGTADPEILGVHLEGAGDAARAGTMYARAADNSAKALAFDHSSRLYRRAIDLLRPEGPERVSLYRRLGDAFANGGRCAEAAPRYLEASVGAARIDSLELRFRAAYQFLLSGNVEAWHDLVGPIQAELGIALPRSSLLALLRIMRDMAVLRVRGFGFTPRPPESLTREDHLRLEILQSYSTVYSMIHMFQGLQYHTHQLRMVLRLGDPRWVSYVLSAHKPWVRAFSDTRGRYGTHVRAVAKRLAEDVGGPYTRALFLLGEGMAQFMEGNWDRAKAPLAASETLFREECVGSWGERHIMVLWGLMCGDFLGEFTDLAARAPLALRDAEERGNLYLATDLRTRILYLPLLAADDAPRAEEEVDAAIGRWANQSVYLQHFRWFEARMHLALYRGEWARAKEVLLEQWPRFKETFFLYVPLLHRVFLVLRGRLGLLEASSMEDGPDRRRLLSEVDRDARRLLKAHQPYAAGWGRLLRAGLASTGGDSEAACRDLAAAEERFAESKMAAYVAVCRRRRGTLLEGEEGRRLVADADAYFKAQGILNPASWTRMYAPGFVD